MLSFLTTTTQTLDTGLVSEVMDIVVEVITKAVALFAIFPLN